MLRAAVTATVARVVDRGTRAGSADAGSCRVQGDEHLGVTAASAGLWAFDGAPVARQAYRSQWPAGVHRPLMSADSAWLVGRLHATETQIHHTALGPNRDGADGAALAAGACRGVIAALAERSGAGEFLGMIDASAADAHVSGAGAVGAQCQAISGAFRGNLVLAASAARFPSGRVFLVAAAAKPTCLGGGDSVTEVAAPLAGILGAPRCAPSAAATAVNDPIELRGDSPALSTRHRLHRVTRLP